MHTKQQIGKWKQTKPKSINQHFSIWTFTKSRRQGGRQQIAGHLCNLFRIQCAPNCSLQPICTALCLRSGWSRVRCQCRVSEVTSYWYTWLSHVCLYFASLLSLQLNFTFITSDLFAALWLIWTWTGHISNSQEIEKLTRDRKRDTQEIEKNPASMQIFKSKPLKTTDLNDWSVHTVQHQHPRSSVFILCGVLLTSAAFCLSRTNMVDSENTLLIGGQ